MRGPQVMQGYWGRPDETKAVLTADGWLRTGDIGAFDAQGYLKLLDRKKDMVIVSGFKVFPNEVEDIAMQHPDVLEAAVIGVPDERTGQAVKLFVVKRDPALTAADLIDVSARAPGELQGAAHHRVSRQPAEEQYRQNSAQRAALRACARAARRPSCSSSGVLTVSRNQKGEDARPMAKLQLSFACGLYDRMQPLYTGEVTPDGIDLNFIAIDQPRPIFDRMSGGEEFDVAEYSLVRIHPALRPQGVPVRRHPGVPLDRVPARLSSPSTANRASRRRRTSKASASACRSIR